MTAPSGYLLARDLLATYQRPSRMAFEKQTIAVGSLCDGRPFEIR